MRFLIHLRQENESKKGKQELLQQLKEKEEKIWSLEKRFENAELVIVKLLIKEKNP